MKENSRPGEPLESTPLHLVPTEATLAEVKSVRHKMGLTIEGIVVDPAYRGPIRSIISTMGDPGAGGYPDTFLSFTFKGEFGQTLVQHLHGDVYVYDPSLTKLEIALALESFKVFVRSLNLHNSVFTSLGYVRDEEDARRRGLPDDQILRDDQGNLRRNLAGNPQVIFGRFHYEAA